MYGGYRGFFLLMFIVMYYFFCVCECVVEVSKMVRQMIYPSHIQHKIWLALLLIGSLSLQLFTNYFMVFLVSRNSSTNGFMYLVVVVCVLL